jgi:hypothetical protein
MTFTKFVKVAAAMEHELRKTGHSGVASLTTGATLPLVGVFC